MTEQGDTTKRDPVVLPLPHGSPATDSTRLSGVRAPELDATQPDDEVLPLPGQRRAPERIGGYEVERELARGGMGIVYVARSLRLERRVALKVLRSGARADAEEVERFLVEARAAARLKHPNIVAIHEADRDGERWFLAMDLIDGESLRAKVAREGPLAPRQAATLARDVARALQYAHERGVVHRDVKPHNVLVDAAGTAYVTDFGLAKELEREEGITVTGQVLGTPAYMPPEQANGDLARVDRRSDVYALGATLYELLTGRPPFQAPSSIALLRKVLEEEPVPPAKVRAGLDRDLETIVLTCLMKDPARRYDTCALLADDLERWLRDEPIRARRPGLAERAWRLVRRHRRLSAAFAALPFAVALLVGASMRAGVQEERARARARFEAARAVVRWDVGCPRPADLRAAYEALDAALQWRGLEPTEEARAAQARTAMAIGDLERRAGDLTMAREAYLVAGRAGADVSRAAQWCRVVEEARRLTRSRSPFNGLILLDEASALAPAWAAALHAYRAEGHLALGDEARARGELERARRLEPDDFVVLSMHVDLLERLGDAAGARRALDRLLELAPDDAMHRVRHAQLSLACQDRAQVAVDIERALAIAGRTASTWLWAGDMYNVIGDRDRAVAAYCHALGLDPAPHASVGLARALLKAGDPRGLALAEMAARAFPEEINAQLVWLEAQAGAGRDVRGACRGLDALIERHPRLIHALTLRARCRLLLRDPAGAEDDASRALELDSTFVDAAAMRAKARLGLGDLRGASTDIERHLRRHPNHPMTLATRAELRAMQGDRAGALADAARVVELEPGDRDFRMLYANLLSASGDHAATLAAYEAVLAITPDFPFALVGRASALLALGRGEEARAVCDRAIAIEPRIPQAYSVRGEARLRLGDAGGADDLRHFLELVPDAPGAARVRAMLAEAEGR